MLVALTTLDHLAISSRPISNTSAPRSPPPNTGRRWPNTAPLVATLGRFTTEADIDYTIDLLRRKVAKLRELSPLWEMYKDGVDINTVQWAAH